MNHSLSATVMTHTHTHTHTAARAACQPRCCRSCVRRRAVARSLSFVCFLFPSHVGPTAGGARSTAGGRCGNDARAQRRGPRAIYIHFHYIILHHTTSHHNSSHHITLSPQGPLGLYRGFGMQWLRCVTSVTCTLHSHCIHIAFTLHSHCIHIACTLPLHLQWSCTCKIWEDAVAAGASRSRRRLLQVALSLTHRDHPWHTCRFGPYAVVQFAAWEGLRSLCGMRAL